LRSTQNVHIERVWRDIRKDSLEAFRQTFAQLEEQGFLDVKNPIHHAALYLVYQPHIQASLDRTREAWNLHKIRTAGNRSPIALFELGRTQAINGGYWHTNPGDPTEQAQQANYGLDPDAPVPPADELTEDPVNNNGQEDNAHHGASLKTDAELDMAAHLLKDMDLEEEDEDWGIGMYRRAVHVLESGLGEDVSD